MSRVNKKKKKKINLVRFTVFLLIVVAIVVGVVFAILHFSAGGYNSEKGFNKFAKEYFKEIGKHFLR
ncbi:MAG: hypothetical protein RR472_01415 [Anaerovoracaceae bacterium]